MGILNRARSIHLCFVLGMFAAVGFGTATLTTRYGMAPDGPSGWPKDLLAGFATGLAGLTAWRLICGRSSRPAWSAAIGAGIFSGILFHPYYHFMAAWLAGLWRWPPALLMASLFGSLIGLVAAGIITIPAGVVAAIACRTLADMPDQISTGRRGRGIGSVAAIVAVVAVALAWQVFNHQAAYDPPHASFQGESEALRQTIVMPTLDSALPPGKSAIWCAAFEVAWDRLMSDVVKAPVQLDKELRLVSELNRGEVAKDDLVPADYFAAAGLVRDGIAEEIRKEMATRFPHVPAPSLATVPQGAVAYSYMQAAVPFALPFFDNDEQFLFTDSSGKDTWIGSFGIRRKDDYAYHNLRDQVQVLHCSEDAGHDKVVNEFIIDPCKTSSPYQLVLARIAPKATLAATLADVRQRIRGAPAGDFRSRLHPRDSLIVPNMNWALTHHFRELEGKAFGNPSLRGVTLESAVETLRFRLDKSGAELGAESKILVLPTAAYFEFNRPFLTLLRKRGSEHPLFVMWVDNAELLSKRP